MPEVVGREAELDALLGFLDAVPEGPCALVFEGEPGIGKTTLWSAGVALAKERSFRILTCRSAESEAKLSYAALLDLLGWIPSEATEALPEVQRHALDVALLRTDPAGVAMDPRTVGVAVLGVIRWCAAAGPVVVALDDPQWMDSASADVLAYAIRRLEDEPIGILAAVRTQAASDDGSLDLRRVLAEERVQRVGVGPLSEEAIGRLVRARLGAEVLASVLLEVPLASGGNPLFALEIARATVQGRPEGSGATLLLPASLKAQVGSRLAAMSPEAQGLALAAASLSRPTVTLALRAADADDGVLAEAVRADILEIDGQTLRFTHPLYASVAYAGAAAEDRSRIHGRLGDLVSDPEERARHLALAGAPPDAAIGDALEEAAERARSRGAPRAAAELCLEARRFTPEDRAEDRRRRVLLAADELYEVGEISRVVALLEGVLATCPGGSARAEVLGRLARAGTWGESEPLDMGESWLEQAEAEAGDDPSLGSLIHRYHFWVARQRYRYAVAAEHAHPALELAGSAGDPAARAASLALFAWAEMVSGRGMADEVIREALGTWEVVARTPSGSPIAFEDHPGFLCGEVLLVADRLDEARAVVEAVRQEASDRGSEAALAIALYWLFEVELLGGNWDLVPRYVEQASRLQVNTNVARLMKGTIAAHLGRADEARRDLMRGFEIAQPKGIVDALVGFLHKLGFLELSLGNLADAHRHLSRATALFMETGILDPGFGRFLSDAIETLVGLGELAEAERLTDWLEERARALDRVSALATGARCRGLLLAAKADHEAALEHLERAMLGHDRLPMPFERARTLLVLGSVRRRANHRRAAREALTEALGIFERLGAVLWADKAKAELASIGGRRVAVGELTPMEARVTHLAAAGRTNREIADSLFLSVRTVESHLSHAYAKLGVRSRTELALEARSDTT